MRAASSSRWRCSSMMCLFFWCTASRSCAICTSHCVCVHALCEYLNECVRYAAPFRYFFSEAPPAPNPLGCIIDQSSIPKALFKDKHLWHRHLSHSRSLCRHHFSLSLQASRLCTATSPILPLFDCNLQRDELQFRGGELRSNEGFPPS